MNIKGKVFCFFEQSGTFKRAFREFGIPAADYDIQNNFGETDHVVDLFSEIERGYRGEPSVFDSVSSDDLIMAFFPCIEFSGVSQIWFSLNCKDYHNWPCRKRVDYMLDKNRRRAFMFDLLMKFCCICLERGIRMVFENPWLGNTYLRQNVFLKRPSVVDWDRSERGDLRIKPTAYWFFNSAPTRMVTYQQTPRYKIKLHRQLRAAPHAGLCSEERSMISPDYARNFIADFILGKPASGGKPQQPDFFD